MKVKIGLALLTMAGIVALSSCTKDPLKNMTEDESRVYITNHDSSANFSTYKTYSIVDSVTVINNHTSGKQNTDWDLSVIAAVKAAMDARGFVRVDRTQNPDLGINITRLYNTTTNVVSYPDYWGGYGGYYDPYYWGYGGYGYYFPSSYGLYQTTDASLSIDMLDLKNASGTRTINGVWNGLIRGSGIFRSSNVQSQVQALFDQSTYLKTTQ